MLQTLTSTLADIVAQLEGFVDTLPRGVWVFVAIIVGLYFCLGLIKGNP
jgi:hypothetical protein